MDTTKFVDFERYCKTCAYQKIKEADEPCRECLGVPARKNSSRPVNWKEKAQ